MEEPGFRKYFIYLFTLRPKGKEGESEGDNHQLVASHTPAAGTWPATQACALTGNQIGNLLVSRAALSPVNHTSQGRIGF